MDGPEDPGGRSGIFPRVDLFGPAPAQADAPRPRRRPTPLEPGSLESEAPPHAEGEDLARYEDTLAPGEDAPATNERPASSAR